MAPEGPSPPVSNSVHPEFDRPYPLCLLCLTRPPSAVLLPFELIAADALSSMANC